MSKNIHGSVIVITGASSGIGRATALEFARRGAHVVVAARREQPLNELIVECQQLGVQAVAVPTDVTDEVVVQNLANTAVEKMGRIDVWLNNAGVSVFGRLDDIPTDVYRRVIETNLFGYIYGARAALRQFRIQGSGILINNASMDSKIGAPYLSAYIASKFAIRGFSESLRQEVEVLDHANIHVCTILPATIDTPFFQHSANYSGRAVKALPPVYDVEMAAKLIANCAEKPRREVFVGGAGRMINILHKVSPGVAERMFARQVDSGHLAQDDSAPPSVGNLFEPMPEGNGVSGGWGGKEKTQVRRITTTGVVALVPALLFGIWAWQRQRNVE